MVRKKTSKRKINYHKSCYATWPQNIADMIVNDISGYQKTFKYVYFGITTDPKLQYDEHTEKDDVQWNRMVVRYRTDNPIVASQFFHQVEEGAVPLELIENWAHDNVDFPESLFEERKPFYVYLLLGKRRKARKEEDAMQLQAEQEYSIQQVLGWAIAKNRRKQRITQLALAKLAGINVSYLWEVEHGKSNVSVQILERIALALGLKLSYLFHVVEKFQSSKD